MLVFDLETDGLYDDVTRIHCLVIYDSETDQTLVFNDEGSEEPISRGVQLLETADIICGHNVISYDIPVLQKVYPGLSRPPWSLTPFFCRGYITTIS